MPEPRRATNELLHLLARTRPDWREGDILTAYGLFRGPWEIVMPDGRSVWSFPLADAPAEAVSA